MRRVSLDTRAWRLSCVGSCCHVHHRVAPAASHRDTAGLLARAGAAWYSITIYATRWFTDDLFSKGWMAMLMIGITLVCTRVRVSRVAHAHLPTPHV